MEYEQMNSSNGQELRTNVMINYLPSSMNQEELKVLFNCAGQVETCKLITDKVTKQSLGYGFITYKTEAEALRAVGNLNGLKLQNKILKVSLAMPPNSELKQCNLYISGLPLDWKENDLDSLFGSYGTVVSSKVMTDNSTGQSRGTGFVRMSSLGECERVIENLDSKKLPNYNQELKISFSLGLSSKRFSSMSSTPNGSQVLPGLSNVNLYVANIPKSWNQSNMDMIFSPYGSITSSKIMSDPVSGDSKGFGFVCYQNRVCCEQAIKELNNHVPVPDCEPLIVRFAKEPDSHDKHKQEHHIINSMYASPNPANLSLYAAAAGQSYAYQPYSQMASSFGPMTPNRDLAGYSSRFTPLAATDQNVVSLFVFNIPQNYGEPELWKLFGPYGAITSVKLMVNKDKNTKGYAFVNMRSCAEAANAVQNLNGRKLENKVLHVSFKK